MTYHEPIGVLLTQWRPKAAGAPSAMTNAFTPLLGKPMLQRSVECLVGAGCKRIHVFLGEDAGPVQALLGQGQRWGVLVEYHYFQPGMSLASALKRLNLAPEQPLALGCDNTVPMSYVSDLAVPAAPFWLEAPSPQWAGIALLPMAWTKAFEQVYDTAQLGRQLFGLPNIKRQAATQPLTCLSDGEFLNSARRLMEQSNQRLRQLGANVHPTATLVEPVYIGQQVRIGPNAHIGPNAVLEDRCVIDAGTEVRDSLVLPDTYVGEELSLSHCIAQQGALCNVRQGALLPVTDPALLASVHGDKPLTRPPMPVRAALQALQWALYPLAKKALRRLASMGSTEVAERRFPSAGQPLFGAQKMALLPTASGHDATQKLDLVKHFALTFYPGLQSVTKGDLALWGPDLREAEDVAQLPAHWMDLHMAHRAGLLSPSVLQAVRQTQAHEQDMYLADVAAVTDSVQPLALVWQYLKAVGRALRTC